MARQRITQSFPSKLSALLERFRAEERPEIEALFRDVLEDERALKISNLWEQPEPTVTYWIFLLTGIDQEEEMEIAIPLLTWKAFFAKDSAQVLCIQSSERQFFRCCSTHFGTIICPTLLLGDTSEMQNFIKIEPQLLFKLGSEKGELRRFMARIHLLIENGSTLREVKAQLGTEHFWSGFKVVFSEVEGLVSLGTINTNMEEMSQVQNPVCFLSHNRQDKNLVRGVASILHGYGIETWFDEWEILPGDKITEKIEEGLSQATSVVIFLSPHAVASEWVKEEMHTALYQTISTGRLQIIPVVVTQCRIPLLLSNYSRIEVGDDKTQIADKIQRAILRITGKPPVRRQNN